MRLVFVAVALLLSTSAFAEDAWMTVDSESTRFADAVTKGPNFTKGDKVEVLFREGDRTRVRKGNEYGWLAASALTATAPKGAPAAPKAPAMSSADIQKMIDDLKKKGMGAGAKP